MLPLELDILTLTISSTTSSIQKWSYTLNRFCSICSKIFKVCMALLWIIGYSSTTPSIQKMVIYTEQILQYFLQDF